HPTRPSSDRRRQYAWFVSTMMGCLPTTTPATRMPLRVAAPRLPPRPLTSPEDSSVCAWAPALLQQSGTEDPANGCASSDEWQGTEMPESHGHHRAYS